MAEAKEHQNPSDEGTTLIATKLTHVRPDNLPSVYINAANVALSQLEFRMYLAETTPNVEGDSVIITDKLCIVMTPEFAKYIANRMLKTLTDYEETFGKLRELTHKDDGPLGAVGLTVKPADGV